jgi:hypothetical protein
MDRMYPKTCVICGDEFVTNYKHRKRQTCSWEHWQALRRKTFELRPPSYSRNRESATCKECGREFIRTNPRRVFCSKKCRCLSQKYRLDQWRHTHTEKHFEKLREYRRNHRLQYNAYKNAWDHERRMARSAVLAIVGEFPVETPLWFWGHYSHGYKRHKYLRELRLSKKTLRLIMRGDENVDHADRVR